MTNKDLLINRLLLSPSMLRAELDYYMNDVDHEDFGCEYTLADAFDDYLNLIQGNNGAIPVLVKQILIEVGYCIPVDISQVTVSHGKRYWFKHDGLHYDCVSSWEQWINS